LQNQTCADMQSMRFLFKTQPARSMPANVTFTRKVFRHAVTPTS